MSTPSMSAKRLAIAVFLGIAYGFLPDYYLPLPHFIATLFINGLKLISLPIIFFSIISTFSSMEDVEEAKVLGKRVFSYALLTTVLAASVALMLFLAIDPAGSREEAAKRSLVAKMSGESESRAASASIAEYFVQLIPENFIKPFVENNAVGVVFLAVIFSLSLITLPKETRKVLQPGFASLFAVFMQMTSFLIRLMPIGVFAFIAEFAHEVRLGLDIRPLIWYLATVIGANLVQALVILPLFLIWKRVDPIAHFRQVLPALTFAFFSKSSSATLPLTINCCEEGSKVSPKVARFTLPLCATINMNACAAFILISVLFVSMKEGMIFTLPQLVLWIALATIAAFGNAAVPMGCYFMASAFLAAMDIPLYWMGAILPFYSLLDMLETAINVWSDTAITVAVQRDVEK